MIRDEYAYHMPNERQLEIMTLMRTVYSTLSSTLHELPNSRYRALALTSLEESAMWTNKAIVLGEDNASDQE